MTPERAQRRRVSGLTPACCAASLSLIRLPPGDRGRPRALTASPPTLAAAAGASPGATGRRAPALGARARRLVSPRRAGPPSRLAAEAEGGSETFELLRHGRD